MVGASASLTGPRRPNIIFSEVWKTIDVPKYVELVRGYGYIPYWFDENNLELSTPESVVKMHKEMSAIQNILFKRTDLTL